MKELKLEILHNAECHTWEKLAEELKTWLHQWGLGGNVELVVTLVNTDEEAIKLKFAGSPMILVNGKDVDPMAERITNYHVSGCRVYFWNGKVFEYPPKAMVEKALIDYAYL